ncbi:hypothetical protein [Pelagibius sp.]|uniref:hypothetical protein n=1 Tax=Pelagibius sp. TaxID=1931238 RepID=UPI00261D353D|nr:hypothetical protein [Pelagibius sp.]
MTEPLERATLIEQLEKLGSAEDEEALAAARKLHGMVTDADQSWDALIVPEDDEESLSEDLEEDDLDDEEPEDEGEDEPADEADEPLSPEAQQAQNAEALRIIEKLLAGANVSDGLREELEGYKSDIEEGEFTTGDLRYLKALSARLGKGAAAG